MKTELSEALRKIGGRSAGEIRREKAAAVEALKRELQGDIESAKRAMARLEAFFAGEVQPFIGEVERASTKDVQIAGWVYELERLSKKPQELWHHIEAVNKIQWSDLAQVGSPDQLDERKRDALLRHLRNSLTRFGDIEGSARRYMGVIETHVLQLAEQTGGMGWETGFQLRPPDPPGEDGPEMKRSVRKR